MRGATTTRGVPGGAAWLAGALDLPEGATPFPWQEELLQRFVDGSIVRSLDIPTGLGKTAVIGIWLVARAHGAALPRRLVYVVDRRAVVDQATDVAEELREYVERNAELSSALGLAGRPLPISTLRGQHVDNREWLEDPSSPAIIVGTVDMIGSRLLFEGYGTSRKMRPNHAGLLGADALLVLDEAHLVPPFEKLIEAIAGGGNAFGPRDPALRSVIPPFRLLSLSATGRDVGQGSFRLGENDLAHSVVRQRLDAPKRLVVRRLDDKTPLADVLADHAWSLSEHGTQAVRCIVFTNKRTDATAVKKGIEKLAKGDKKAGTAPVIVDTELFVGGRRVFERTKAAARLAELGFMKKPTEKLAKGDKRTSPAQQEEPVLKRPAFLIATSAGEVGVDLDADHMVSDLVAWERMVQRLGRVNRRGKGVAEVIVVVEPEPTPKKSVQEAREKPVGKRSNSEKKELAAHEAALGQARALSKLLEHLPPCENEAVQAGPGALRELKLTSAKDQDLRDLIDTATTPEPLRPALSRALVDAWSMTSLKKHTGRPEVAPWLRGWVTDPPQTIVVWRTHLPIRSGGVNVKQQEAFFEAAPPHASEQLESETFRVVDWLAARARALFAGSTEPGIGDQEVAAFVLGPAGDLHTTLTWRDLQTNRSDKKAEKARKDRLRRDLASARLVVDARVGGLEAGLLDEKQNDVPRTIDDGEDWIPSPRFRVRSVEAGQPTTNHSQWRERFRFATKLSDDGEARWWLIIEKWRHDAATEDDRSVARPQLLENHLDWTKTRVEAIANRIGLPDEFKRMLAVAAQLHDEGKRARRWQHAFNAPQDGTYAKTLGPVRPSLLDGYRHEFGSLPVAAKDSELSELSNELRDLALHLIAAHHGFARPLIGTSGCEDAPPSALEESAREVALRFARLQKRWGPWGLAWWESLLRAADRQASRDNDKAVDPASQKDGD